MGKDFLDDFGVFDDSDDFQFALASWTDLDIDVEHSLKKPGPCNSFCILGLARSVAGNSELGLLGLSWQLW